VRILYIIDSLVPSGAERSLAEMVPFLGRHDVEITVAYLQERPGLQDEVRAAGARLACVAGRGGRAGRILRIRHLIRGWQPHLVHTTLAEADLAGRMAARLERTPVVSSLVNDRFGPEQRRVSGTPAWKLGAARVLDVATARWVTRFHAITGHVAEVMARRLRVPRTLIDVVPRGRNPDRLGRREAARRRAARSALGIRPEVPVLLAVARHERQKGLDVLLRAMPEIVMHGPGTVLLVAGRPGNETAALRRLTQRLFLQDSVRFLGLRADVPDLLCAADSFVLPSRWEGLGSVLLEAMALESPIVASDLPAVREVVDHGRSALLVPPLRPDLLSELVTGVLADRAGARARAAVARARFLEHFTSDRVTEQMAAFYRRALAG
jgi:glycosyltransferase involved in cell wall biosynthesis